MQNSFPYTVRILPEVQDHTSARMYDECLQVQCGFNSQVNL